MPRRSDASERVGLCSIVRARISSKLANVAGPRTKSVIALALSRSTPGVMSTSTSLRTRSERRSARAMAVSPPRDMPTTARGIRRQHGDRLCRHRWRATRRGGARRRTAAPSEWPCPGRSTATSGRSRARATVSQVWAFWAPPWMSTSSGGADPHTRALIRRARSDIDGRTANRGRGVVGDPRLGGVVGEVGELVVGNPCRGNSHPAVEGGGNWVADVGDGVGDVGQVAFGVADRRAAGTAPLPSTGRTSRSLASRRVPTGSSCQRQRCPLRWHQAITRSWSNSTTLLEIRYGTPTFMLIPNRLPGSSSSGPELVATDGLVTADQGMVLRPAEEVEDLCGWGVDDDRGAHRVVVDRRRDAVGEAVRHRLINQGRLRSCDRGQRDAVDRRPPTSNGHGLPSWLRGSSSSP